MFRNFIKKSYLLTLFSDFVRKIYLKYFISKEKHISKIFQKKLKRQLDLDNPILYNDKIQWLKINWKNQLATNCADKLAVRSFVSERIGSQYLNEIYGIYDKVENIDLNNLPEKFVLKVTHGSGFNVICSNKSLINWKSEIKKIKRWLKMDYYLFYRENVYKEIKPKIICEKYLEQLDSPELRDYRFFCFDGNPKFISVDFNIVDKSKTRRNLYDLKWNLMTEEISYPKEEKLIIPKPKHLDEMIYLSRKLSDGFPHARIDFYYINESIIFGEITFFHQSGFGKFRPIEFEKYAGDLINIENIKNISVHR